MRGTNITDGDQSVHASICMFAAPLQPKYTVKWTGRTGSTDLHDETNRLCTGSERS